MTRQIAASVSTSSTAGSQQTFDPEEFYSPEPHRHIKDIIYDLIPVAPHLSRFIDTKPFQRLRTIKQLGTTTYVWPGASHSRFEHSLGVAYLARCLASHLQSSQPELNITHRDVACVEIAGLCHDLGHGPWSHVWDGIFMPHAKAGSSWTHEEGSEMMVDYIIERHRVPMPSEDVAFIKALIAGEPAQCSPGEKKFLFDIVANKRNGIDVDKFDYIQRDSRMLGESMSISLTRILKSARVIDDQICYNIKDADSILNICSARFSLHKRFYNHKTAKAIEYMIVDALLSADPHMKIAERVFDPEKFLQLDDTIKNEIEKSEDPKLEKAREIFSRISERDLYNCVDYKVVEWGLRQAFKEWITPEKIVEASRGVRLESVSSEPTATEVGDIEMEQRDANPGGLGDEAYEGGGDEEEILQPEDVVVDFATMHYGMKGDYPLDHVRFYSKARPNDSMHAGPGVLSGLLPSVFAEVMLRVYTKKPKFFLPVQAGFRALLVQMEKALEEEGVVEPVRAGGQQPISPPTSATGDADEPFEAAGPGCVVDAVVKTPITPAMTAVTLPGTPQDDTSTTSAGSTNGNRRRMTRVTSNIGTPNWFTTLPPGATSPSAFSGKPISKGPLASRVQGFGVGKKRAASVSVLKMLSSKGEEEEEGGGMVVVPPPVVDSEDAQWAATLAPSPVINMEVFGGSGVGEEGRRFKRAREEGGENALGLEKRRKV